MCNVRRTTAPQASKQARGGKEQAAKKRLAAEILDADDDADDASTAKGDPSKKCTYKNGACPRKQSSKDPSGPFCLKHTCPECGYEKRQAAALCTQKADGKFHCTQYDGYVPEEIYEEYNPTWKAKGKRLAALHGSQAVAVISAIVYYVDFGTDVRFVVELDRCGENLPSFFFYIVLAILVLHPVALTIADQFGGMGLKGILLNFTNTRMLYSLSNALFGGTEDDKTASARATHDAKLFEAVFESMPQLYVQMIVLLHYSDRCSTSQSETRTLLYLSITISVMSTAVATTTKFFHIFARCARFKTEFYTSGCDQIPRLKPAYV
jgi:hypothetical protein